MTLLIFLHGLGDTPQAWQDQVTALPAGRTAVAPWLRGSRPGQSVEFAPDAAADDVLGLLNTYGVDSAVLCGQGLGALVALTAAARSPQAVAGLVLTGTPGAPSASALRAQAAMMRLVPAATYRARGVDKKKLLVTLAQLATVDLASRLASVVAPTLVVCGSDDRAGLPLARDLVRRLADARLEVVAGAGARVPQEAPAAFSDLLYSFGEA